MNNINIEHQNLNSIIDKLKLDVANIDEVFKNGSTSIGKLENNWIGPDKVKSDEYFNYIEISSRSFLQNINNCIDLLEKANSNYQQTDNDIKSDVDTLNS